MDANVAGRLRYVAMGDSYTIGTSVDPVDSWPVRLVSALAGPAYRGDSLELVANLAVNGRTTAELVREQLSALAALRPQFVSVLIGVNDVVRGIPIADYEANLRRVFESLLERLPPERILTVGIPDYTVTPRGMDYGDPVARSHEIETHNDMMARLSAELGISHVAVVDLSRRAATERALVAADGLHPSGVQYGLWVERIASVVADLLATPSAAAH